MEDQSKQVSICLMPALSLIWTHFSRHKINIEVRYPVPVTRSHEMMLPAFGKEDWNISKTSPLQFEAIVVTRKSLSASTWPLCSVVFSSSKLAKAVYIQRDKSRFWPRNSFSNGTSNQNDNLKENFPSTKLFLIQTALLKFTSTNL